MFHRVKEVGCHRVLREAIWVVSEVMPHSLPVLIVIYSEIEIE
jgi:hypothetical protein